MASVTLDAAAFPDALDIQAEATIGGLEITSAQGDTDGDGDFDVLYSFGARSFSIWKPGRRAPVGQRRPDRADYGGAALPDDFNSTNDENGSLDDRSDNSGPEPEDIVIGQVGDSTYAFIGLERIGGVVVFDVTDPSAPAFVTYVNNRDFSGDPEAGTAGDLGSGRPAVHPGRQQPDRRTAAGGRQRGQWLGDGVHDQPGHVAGGNRSMYGAHQCAPYLFRLRVQGVTKCEFP